MSKNNSLHGALNPWFKAVKKSKYKIEILPMNMNMIRLLEFRPFSKFGFFLKLNFVISHFIFSLSVWEKKHSDLVIVREFLNIPTLLCWPIFFPLRNSLLFVVNHNIQVAHARKLERLAFKLLVRLGLRPLFLESNDGVNELGIDTKNLVNLILPQPIELGKNLRVINKHKVNFLVGIIGDIREEKGSFDLIKQLLRLDVDLLIGVKNPELVAEFKEYKNVKIVTTSNYSDYINAYEYVDLTVLNYDRDSYYYRCSGVICDAIATNTIVLCPDFPIFKKQIKENGIVGETFDSLEQIEQLIEYVKNNVSKYASGFETQRRYRSIHNFLMSVDDFIEKNK